MGLSHAYGTPLATAEAADKVRVAVEMGYTFLDTAEYYTGTNPVRTTVWPETIPRTTEEGATGLARRASPTTRTR